jgi:hypothetical protein
MLRPQSSAKKKKSIAIREFEYCGGGGGARAMR